jgi:hypothetical protein
MWEGYSNVRKELSSSRILPFHSLCLTLADVLQQVHELEIARVGPGCGPEMCEG